MRQHEVATAVAAAVAELPVRDVHTHLFDPGMGSLLLHGIDEILTYHYHVAELFRVRPDLDGDSYWRMPLSAQADLVWQELFVERTPLSEVGRGVVAMLAAYGIDPNQPDLRRAREFFAARDLRAHVDATFAAAGVADVYMTNDPLDSQERACWERGFDRDPRFHAALRLDSALVDWPAPVARLRALDYDVSDPLDGSTIDEVRRYLDEWARRIDAGYMAISLPPTFRFPDPHSATSVLLEKAVIPSARGAGCPIALMIGVRRQVNPKLRAAGDAVGRADVATLARLAGAHEDVTFLVTYLSRENQHELCAVARKFPNVRPFGCWWFVNNSSLVTEITTMRLDMLGPTFIPQHSDARVLEQLVFKWRRSRQLVGAVLAERYADLAGLGRTFEPSVIRADLERMFGGGLAR